MPRPKKQTYEWVPKLKKFRKRLKDADGKWVAIYGNTEAELSAKIRDAEAIIAAGLEMRRDPTVEQYAAEWLPLETAAMGEKHAAEFARNLRTHALPVLGQIRLRDVRPNDIAAVMGNLTDKSFSLNSKVLNAMKRLFENAVDNGIIAQNPCAKIKAGGVKAKRKKALTAEQIQILVDAVRGTRAELFVLLGLYAGLRREEIMGLRWENIHLDSDPPWLEVCLVATYPGNNKPVVSEILKSDAAARTIPLATAPQLLAALKKSRKASGFVYGGEKACSCTQFRNIWGIVERRSCGEGYYNDIVDGKYRRVKIYKEKGKKSRTGDYCYTIDFDVTPHILRHTCASHWIAAGIDPKTVQYLLGHADPDITLGIYSHVIETNPQALSAAMRPLTIKKGDRG